jgi:hypothetical protein
MSKLQLTYGRSHLYTAPQAWSVAAAVPCDSMTDADGGALDDVEAGIEAEVHTSSPQPFLS